MAHMFLSCTYKVLSQSQIYYSHKLFSYFAEYSLNRNIFQKFCILIVSVFVTFTNFLCEQDGCLLRCWAMQFGRLRNVSGDLTASIVRAMKIKAVSSSETSVNIHQTARCNIP
jgi:hypothetical protein